MWGASPGVVPRGQQVVTRPEADVLLAEDELDLWICLDARGQVVAGGVVEDEHARVRRVRQHGRQAGLQVRTGAVVDELDRDVERHGGIIGSPWGPS